MNKQLLVLTIALFGLGEISAQDLPFGSSVNVEKIGRISMELGLSEKEAIKFWPIYNQHQKEKKELKQQMRKATQFGRRRLSKMKDEEIEKIVLTGLSFKEKEIALKRKYISIYEKAIPMHKIASLYRMDHSSSGAAFQMPPVMPHPSFEPIEMSGDEISPSPTKSARKLKGRD